VADANLIADKLDEARALIEKGWCQGEYARGKSGRKADPTGRYAACFCAVGALGAANRQWPWGGMLGLSELNAAIGSFRQGEVPILDWNDIEWRTQAEVIEAFRKAAELARAEASK
jgi:hypothetical protein